MASFSTSLEFPLDQRCINTIRVLSADTVEKANSGHPGAPMGCAPIAHSLFGQYMNFSPSNPKWANRDRFVLSNGHACALLYSMLHLTGYDLSIEDLKQFRQLGSKTPGHPENVITPGVEVSTGPLGQGLSNAVGLAMAEAHLAAQFNREGFNVIDHFTYVICGDGCLQEGITSEASSLAGHWGLGKLIVCYDDNHITIDGDTSISFTEDVNMRYTSYGWHVQVVDDVNDLVSLRAALEAARADPRPSLIKIRTVIGHGSLSEGEEKVHGAPLGAKDLAQVKEKFGFDPSQSFVVPEDVRAFYSARAEAGRAAEAQWNELFTAYAAAHPELAADFERRMSGRLPEGWKDRLPVYTPDMKASATRNRSEEVLNAIAAAVPEFIGGSADLTGSNLTNLRCTGDFQKSSPQGRYLRFGVREHAMTAICNGAQAHGGVRPFCATFLNFIGYAMGAVRVAALSHLGVLHVMTHDSIGLGEDGPTHQPIEMLQCLRALPNLLTFRPCDGNETVGSYVQAMEHPHSPSVLALTRQALPTLVGSSSEAVSRGAYVLQEHTGPEGALPIGLVLLATGSEVPLAVNVARRVSGEHAVGVRVVSMPCWELFQAQDRAYQTSVLTIEGLAVPVMSVEAGTPHGWREFAHAPFGIEGFGLSAPGPKCFAHFGFTEENLTTKALEVVEFYKAQGGCQSPLDFPRLSVSHAPH